MHRTVEMCLCVCQCRLIPQPCCHKIIAPDACSNIPLMYLHPLREQQLLNGSALLRTDVDARCFNCAREEIRPCCLRTVRAVGDHRQYDDRDKNERNTYVF